MKLIQKILYILTFVIVITFGVIIHQLGVYDSKSCDIRNSNVTIYTKEGCKYCIFAKALLEEKSIPYQKIPLEGNRELIISLINKTGQNTVPYVFIDDKFIGGYSDLKRVIDSDKCE